jgi:hypothetical protein
MDSKYIIGFVVAMVVLVGGIAFLTNSSNPLTTETSAYDLDAFAQCLKDKDAKFYGAYWCPHCQATKKNFGTASSKLPYVECSTADGRGQLPICIEKQIESYPTWVFADGTRLGGELTLAETKPSEGYITLKELADASGCQLIPRDGSAPYVPGTVATSTPATATSTATTTGSSAAKAATSTAPKATTTPKR